MIAYLDTSALVPILVEEPSSEACRRLWDDADDVVSSRIAYVEVAAALAQAIRLDRLTVRQRASALGTLNGLWSQMYIVEIDQALVHRAADLADRLALHRYDAVHAASADALNDDGMVAGSGDRQLLKAWRTLGITTNDTNES